MNKIKREALKTRGYLDGLKGRNIDSFQSLNPNNYNVKRLNESHRGIYEIGFRIGFKEMIKSTSHKICGINHELGGKP